MVTVAPTGADVGVKPLIVGRRTTMRSVAAVVVPPGVVMVMRPVCAVAGTVMRTSVSVLDAVSTGAGTEPIRATAPPSVVPVIVIEPLTRATVGANDVIRGVTAKRWTFVIGKDGKIIYMNDKVNAAEDSKAILDAINKQY